MYAIYADGICIHSDVFALDSMKAISPKLILSDCAAGSLTMTLPSINVGYETVEQLTTDITVEKDGEEIWMGRVLTETKDFWNNRVLYCEGELAFFNDTTQPPKKYAGRTVRGYLEALVAEHNAKVGANRRFQVGAVTVYDDKTPDYFTNYEKTMASLNALIETYGGHMRVRKANGVRYLDYLEECPHTCQQTIQMGINLVDFTKSWDKSEYATVIVPLGARLGESDIEGLDAYVTVEEANGGSVYVQSPSAVAAYGWIEKTVQWDDVTDPSELLEKAQEYLRDLQFDNMQLELSALDMHYLNVDTEAVKLLDKIRVVSLPHGLDRFFPVTELEIPLDSPEKTTFKLGDTVKVSLTNVNNQINNAILNKIETKSYSVLNEARRNAKAILDLATTGYITIIKDENGSQELWITDQPDPNDASRYWRWNLNGLAYINKTDVDPQTGEIVPRIAMTMDGAIVADRITTGHMSADRVRTGVLEATNKNVIFDLDEGKLTMKKGSIQLGAYDRTTKCYMFEVDENGNLYAGSGTFAGNLAAAKGTFGGTLVGVDGDFSGELKAATGTFWGTVRAAKYEDLYGNDMMENGKFKADYLSLKGLTITNTFGQTVMKFNENGVQMYGGAIQWMSEISQSNIDGLEDDLEDLEDLANSASSIAKQIANGTYQGGTFISGTTLYSPTIYSNELIIQPKEAASSGQWKGGLTLKGYYGSTLYQMFKISYNQGTAPEVLISTRPISANVFWYSPNVTFARWWSAADQKYYPCHVSISGQLSLDQGIYLTQNETFGSGDFPKNGLRDGRLFFKFD